jgi:hypothetical protein
MGLTPRDHTQAVLKRMNLAGSVPGNLDRNNDAQGDNYGLTAARSSDASSFKMTGAPKSPHLGRPGRQTGGRIAGDLVRTRRTQQETARDISSEDRLADELGKDRATGGRIDRAYGGHADEREDRALVGKMVKSSAMRASGGRIGRANGGFGPDSRDLAAGRSGADPGDRSAGDPRTRNYTAADEVDNDMPAGSMYNNIPGESGYRNFLGRMGHGASYGQMLGLSKAEGGRVDRARGGRAKGKTTVNVIIGGDKHLTPQGPPPMPPPPMAAPGPVGPPPPPPGGPPPMMPPGGAPMGPAGAPPPGAPPMLRARGGRIGRQIGGGMPMPGAVPPRPMVPPPQGMGSPLQPGQAPPMRAKGGRIEISTPGKHDYGKPGVKHGAVDEKYGGGSGLGRQERARRQK